MQVFERGRGSLLDKFVIDGLCNEMTFKGKTFQMRPTCSERRSTYICDGCVQAEEAADAVALGGILSI